MTTILAIDPGQSGGVAVAQFGKTDCHAMPPTPGDLLALLRDIQRAADIERSALVCVLEEVNGFAGKAQPGSAMFTFGKQFGFIQGVVQALGIRLELVRPQVWQKAFGLGTAARCASKTEWKNKLKAEAQRRFPHLKVTLSTADALLILDYAMRGGFPPRSASRTGNNTNEHRLETRSTEIKTPERERTEGSEGNEGPRGQASPFPPNTGGKDAVLTPRSHGGPEDYLGCGDVRAPHPSPLPSAEREKIFGTRGSVSLPNTTTKN